MNLSVRPARTQSNLEGLRSGDTHIRQEGSRFGATQVSGGVALQGSFVGVTINSTAGRPDYAGQFSHSSLEPVKAYVPRRLLRDHIRTQLCDDAADENTMTLVVWGLGGAGKTQLVLDYVRQYRTDYKATFWIEAGRKESLERDFVNLYQTIFGVQIVAGKETVSVDSAVIGVKSWFSGQRGPWLMVFDGADTIENEEASGYIDIKHFIPDVASLHVIVTSRSSTAKDMTRLEGVQVSEMEEVQAVELFYRYSRLRRDDQGVEDEVKAIVKELGHLALAVTLAATYVGRTPRLQSDIKAYLPEYRRRRRELLKRKPESLIHQYNESVLTTWETSYQAVADQCPGASVLMTMLSFFNFDDIFLQLFSVGRRLESTGSMSVLMTMLSFFSFDNYFLHLFGIGRQLESTGSIDYATDISMPTVDIYRLEECFEMLQRYSFVQWKEDQQSYAMHKLVHAWGYDRLTEDEQHRFSVSTFELVVKAVDGCGNAPEDKLRLVPHVMANFATLANARGALDRAADGTLDELVRVGTFVTDIGRLPEGRVIEEFVLNERRRLFGEKHPSTIGAMSNLANTLVDQGQLDEATKMFKEVLEKRRRILGEEHPDTITAMSNFANTLVGQYQLDEAVNMFKEVLKKRRRILGKEHPDTIMTMNNLAITLEGQGQLDEAAKMNKEVLEKMRRILGEEHPSTISAINNLGSVLAGQGQLDEAAKIFKEVLEKRRRILGEEHPDTITAINNLAIILANLGQLDEAAKIFKEVLEKRRRILGEEHPDTILTIKNLANTLGDLGQLEEAMKMFKEVLEKRRRFLSEEHPDIILTMGNLASALGHLGQLEEAAKMFEEVLEKMRRILGEKHPDTIGAMNNFASTLMGLGQLDKAIALLEIAAREMKRIHGNKHPHTQIVISNLARLSTCTT